MRILIEDVRGTDPPTVIARNELGVLIARWCSDGQPERGEYDVELTVPGSFRWGVDVVLLGTEEKQGLQIQDDRTILIGKIDSRVCDSVFLLTLGPTLVALDIRGNPPVGWPESTLKISTTELEVYDTGY